jgi:hypothetical protein
MLDQKGDHLGYLRVGLESLLEVANTPAIRASSITRPGSGECANGGCKNARVWGLQSGIRLRSDAGLLVMAGMLRRVDWRCRRRVRLRGSLNCKVGSV